MKLHQVRIRNYIFQLGRFVPQCLGPIPSRSNSIAPMHSLIRSSTVQTNVQGEQKRVNKRKSIESRILIDQK